MKPKPSINAFQIMEALSTKHKEDVFVGECKDGPTQSGSHSRLDAWVMKKSWSSPLVIGYEVKVSRSDFMQDSKWRSYLPMCNELYFAAPKGLIADSEVGSEAGLLELIGGNRLIIRKRAPYREVTVPESVYRYILMCRVTVQRPGYFNDADKRQQFRQWLEEKTEDRKLGYLVSKGVRDYVTRVENENRRLKDLMAGYDEVKRAMEAIGLNPNRADIWNIRDKIKAARSIVPEDFKAQLERVKDVVAGMLQQIQTLQPTTPA